MNKGLVIGGLAVVIGGGYFAGIAVTSKQVDQQFQRYVTALEENYKGVADVEAKTESGMFNSQSMLSLTFLDLPEELVEWAGSNVVSFDINYKHGFLKSDSVLTLADSQLLTKLAAYQGNSSQPLLQLNANYSYDYSNSAVSVVGDIKLDSFLIEKSGTTVELGVGAGEFSTDKDTLTFDYKMAPSRVLSNDVTFDIGEVRLNEKVKALGGDILTAKMSESAQGEFSIASIGVKGSGADVVIDQFVIAFDQAIRADRMDLAVAYSAAAVKFKQGGQDFQFDQPKLALNFDVDSQAVIDFVEQVQELQATSGGAIDNPQDILPLLEPITQKGINVSIDTLEVSAAGEKVNGDAKLLIAPFTLDEAMADRDAMRKKLDLTANLTIAKGFLATLPNFDPQQAQFAVTMGFLTEQDDSYKFSATLKDGVMSVNGNPMPLF